MKKYIYIVGLISSLFCFVACDETLDLDIPSEIHKLDTQDKVRAALVGCYNGMQNTMENEWRLTELRSDNAVQGNPGSRNDVNLYLNDLDMFTVLPTHPEVDKYWLAAYKNINNANMVLAALDIIEDGNEQNAIKAEASFIRAYHYFNLVRLFGPLFIVTDRVSEQEAKSKQRSSVDLVYEQIIKDFAYAADDEVAALPEKQSDDNLGRVSRLAAKGMLAKVFLTQGNLVEARKLLDYIVSTGKHELLPYKEVFSINNEMNNEILFSVRYKSGGYGIGSPFANYFAPTSSGNSVVNGDGKGWNFPSYDFMQNAYEANDKRKEITVNTFGNATWVKNYVCKYLSSVAITEDAENDWPVLRYADILLMLAEVINEQEGHTNALPLINNVRATHGDLAPLTMINSQEGCRLAIEAERRVEFAFENHRLFDLMRTNRALDVLNHQIFVADLTFYDRFKDLKPDPTRIVQDWQLLLPIPQREIDTNNQIRISQNYGY